jgi:rare lipoprotein A
LKGQVFAAIALHRPSNFVTRAARAFAMYRCAFLAAALLSIAYAAKAESGLASYYGGRGHRGEMTCAHRSRPMGSIVTVTHAGHSIQCRVNDRGTIREGPRY